MVERLRRRALKENRFDDASDAVINKRMEVFRRETRPVLDLYPKEIVHRIDATLSQIRVLSEIIKILVPLKEALDGPDILEGAAPVATPLPVQPVLAARTAV
jgi:adenylate kinase